MSDALQSNTLSPEVLELTVGAEGAGLRLDKWLADATEHSRARLQGLISEGAVRVGGAATTKPTRKMREGDTVTVALPAPVDATPQPENIPLAIVYEDAALLVVDKPAGMTVHPAPGSRQSTLVNALLHHVGDLSGIGGVLRPGIVHRIDKDTSGLLVVAKSDAAHNFLARQFAAHTVHRRYECFTRATPKPREGRIASRIARSPHDRKKMAVVRGTLNDPNPSAGEHKEKGKVAITNYALVKSYGQLPGAAVGTGRFSRVDCRLETGRTHQIRVHLAHIGCPLLGDPLYGKGRSWRASKHPAEVAVADYLAGFKRQALHARELGFLHPDTRDEMRFSSPLPPDMQGLADLLDRLPAEAT